MLKSKLFAYALLSVWFLLLSQPVSAETDDSRWYAGIGVGLSRLEPERNGSIYGVDDKTSRGYKLTLGYDWSDRIAIEGYFSDLGEAGMSPEGEVGYRDLGAAGLYYLHRDGKVSTAGWEAFIKGGLGWMKNDTDLPYERVHNSHVMFGLGGGYRFGNGLKLRADLDLYDKDSQFFILSVTKGFRQTPQE